MTWYQDIGKPSIYHLNNIKLNFRNSLSGKVRITELLYSYHHATRMAMVEYVNK